MHHGARLGPVRDQGTRPTCLAFALSALNQHAAEAPGFLSVEYLYRQAVVGGAAGDSGLTLAAGLASVHTGQPEEGFVPYEAAEPSAPVTVPTLAPPVVLYRSALLDWVGALHLVESALRRGIPVGLGLRITPSFLTPLDGVVRFEADVFPNATHAVVAVGLGTHEGALHVRVRNSWGDGWGEGGHGWLPWSYLELHTLCIYGETPWPC